MLYYYAPSRDLEGSPEAILLQLLIVSLLTKTTILARSAAHDPRILKNSAHEQNIILLVSARKSSQ